MIRIIKHQMRSNSQIQNKLSGVSNGDIMVGNIVYTVTSIQGHLITCVLPPVHPHTPQYAHNFEMVT